VVGGAVGGEIIITVVAVVAVVVVFLTEPLQYLLVLFL
jgi:hypothetical protein